MKTIGDQIKLLEHFKRPLPDQEKVEKLKELLRDRKRKSTNAFASSDKEKKQKKDLRFEFGWKHWNSKTKKYMYKKHEQGGGNREIYISRTSSLINCLDKAMNIFFHKERATWARQRKWMFFKPTFKENLWVPF